MEGSWLETCVGGLASWYAGDVFKVVLWYGMLNVKSLGLVAKDVVKEVDRKLFFLCSAVSRGRGNSTVNASKRWTDEDE